MRIRRLPLQKWSVPLERNNGECVEKQTVKAKYATRTRSDETACRGVDN